jgi:hypothetical protein
MEIAYEKFQELLKLMPEGWEQGASKNLKVRFLDALAKELLAFTRSREIKTPEDLLPLIFLYLTEGKSWNVSAGISGR